MSETDGTPPARRPRKVLKAFRGSVVTIYWVALPLAAMLTLGALISAGTQPQSPRSWLPAAALVTMTLLIAWRLWLNRRALGRVGPVPPTRRLLTVFLPLGLLALLGLSVLALGLLWLAVAGWLLLAPEESTAGFRHLVMGAGLAMGGGAALTFLGAALTWPLIRLLKTRPVSTTGT